MVRLCSPDRTRAVFAAVALAAYVWAGSTGRAQTARPSDLPSPEQFFGFQMGADRKLANWDKLHAYYQTLARSAKNMRLVELGKSGFRTVVDMRLPDEPRGYDEAAAARAAGLEYVALPIGHEGVPDSTYDRFRDVMSDASRQPVLVHCASGNRVGPPLIAYLVLDRGWSWERAVETARQGGLRTEDFEASARSYVERHAR